VAEALQHAWLRDAPLSAAEQLELERGAGPDGASHGGRKRPHAHGAAYSTAMDEIEESW
jgi:hypothetical protein